MPRLDVSLALLKKRAQFLADSRSFFSARDVLEVQTPHLCTTPPSNPGIAAFKASGRAQNYYLHTSPEFHMKRLLAEYPQQAIYQLCTVYRDDPATREHLPEFTMLEWYRPGFTLHELIQEVTDIIQQLLGLKGFEQISYQQLFKHYLNFDPLGDNVDFAAIARHQNVSVQNDDTLDKDDWLDLLLSHCIQPELAKQKANIVLTGFPASQAELAKLNPQNAKIAERFEVLINGVEIANGYHELQCVDTYLGRLKTDNHKRSQLNLPKVTADETLLQAMKKGLPDSCGVSLGFDRLLMLSTNSSSINQVSV